MTEPLHLEIPERTKIRSRKYQDAARHYIHERQTMISELSRRVGLSPTRLGAVRNSDKWDEFASLLASKTITSVYARSVIIERGDKQTELMKTEVADQIDMVEKLRTERARALVALTQHEPATKPYGAALAALARIRSELEAITGLDDAKSEISALRTDRLKKSRADTESSAGAIVDLTPTT